MFGGIKNFTTFVLNIENMDSLNGYQQVSYIGLQKTLHRCWVDGGSPTHVLIATRIKVKSATTVKNSFHQLKQKVSDEVLTSMMDYLGLKGCVLWNNGKRKYFIKNN